MKKKIAVYTSTRADYGLLKPLISRLKLNANIEVRLFVTGTHLSQTFGYTINEIEQLHKDEIFYRVEHSENREVKYKSLDIMSEVLMKYTAALVQNRPDITIVLGDRYEAFCYVIACSGMGIPIIHLHGGELTFGSLDDKFRHCITKLSEWHFVTCEKYQNRVIQLGENPRTVFNAGALGVDNALNQKLMSQGELEKNLGILLTKESYLFTFHPETNSADFGASLLGHFLLQFEKRLILNKAIVVITGVNSDAGSADIKKIIMNFKLKMKNQAYFFESLGTVRYLSLMKLVTATVGNSSSGILEAHSIGTPTINLGMRQSGRERESSVLDLQTVDEINDFNFDKAIKIKNELRTVKPPSIFGNGNASNLIATKVVQIIENMDDYTKPKEFFDLK